MFQILKIHSIIIIISSLIPNTIETTWGIYKTRFLYSVGAKLDASINNYFQVQAGVESLLAGSSNPTTLSLTPTPSENQCYLQKPADDKRTYKK